MMIKTYLEMESSAGKIRERATAAQAAPTPSPNHVIYQSAITVILNSLII